MSDQKAWTPDQPLRADATDEQMSERFTHLAESALPYFAGGKRYATRIAMAREYAAARVAALPVPPAGTREANAWSIIRRALDAAVRCDEATKSRERSSAKLDAIAAELETRLAALPVPREGEAGTDGPITDAERIDAICRTVAATTDGVTIHDATVDWSVVVLNDGEVCGQGGDVRSALDQMVREDRVVQKILRDVRNKSVASLTASEGQT